MHDYDANNALDVWADNSYYALIEQLDRFLKSC